MEQIENESKRNMNCWPGRGRYYRKKATSDTQIGKAVINLEEKIVRIVRRTINRLDGQAGRQAICLNSVVQQTQPDLLNTNHEIRKQLS